MNNLHSRSDAQLIEEFRANLDVKLASALKRACEILVELIDVRNCHAIKPTGVFSYYRQIASGKILPSFALVFMGMPVMEYAHSMSAERQADLVADDTIATVKVENNGKIVPVSKQIRRMTVREIDTVFSKDGGVRTIDQQRRVVAARANPLPVRRTSSTLNIRADVRKGEIIIGQIRVTPAMLTSALIELGYEAPRKKLLK